MSLTKAGERGVEVGVITAGQQMNQKREAAGGCAGGLGELRAWLRTAVGGFRFADTPWHVSVSFADHVLKQGTRVTGLQNSECALEGLYEHRAFLALSDQRRFDAEDRGAGGG